MYRVQRAFSLMLLFGVFVDNSYADGLGTTPKDIDPSIPFYRNPVYGMGDALGTGCEQFSSGVPIGLWGNRDVNVTETVGLSGKALKIIGTYPGQGGATTYLFFLKKEDCQAAAREKTIAQQPAINYNSNKSGTSAKPLQRLGILATQLNTPKDALAQRFAFSICGNLQGKETCIAPNKLASPPPLKMADGNMPCIIDKEITFTFNRDRVDSVMCETFPSAWSKILKNLQATSGPGQKDVKQFMEMYSETLRWAKNGLEMTLIHNYGKDAQGTPLDSYSVLLTGGR